MTAQRVLDGRYEVGELIGRGGMADVHLGRDTRLGRAVAIKCLRPDLARDPVFQTRFRREAQAVAGMNHMAVVAVYDTGESHVDDRSAEGVDVPFIVMEYVAGRTLRELIRSEQLSIDEAIDHIMGVLAALEYSHRCGIVHRDIKPANVIVTDEGAVKVMDFGIARALADSAATVTQTQAVIGTAQYLSPEQARGETVDARSDLYSAACLLYEMLTGRPPFVGESPVSVAYQHVRESPEPPSQFNDSVGQALDAVLIHALNKDREDRFQDAAAFTRALRAARNGSILTPPSKASAAVGGVGHGGVGHGGTDADQTTALETVPDKTVPAETVPGEAVPGETVPGETASEDASSDETVALDIGGHDAHPETIVQSAVPPGHNSYDGQDGTTRTMGAVLAADSVTAARPQDNGHDHAPGGHFPDVGSTDERPDEHRARRRAWIITLFIVLALVLGVGGFLLYKYLSAPQAPPTVAVPSVTKMSQIEALNALQSVDLRPIIEEEHDKKIPEGHAIGTDPAAGAQVMPNSEVTVHISTGPASIQIPKSLKGKTEAFVRQTLSSLNLRGGSTTLINSATMPPNMLISTEPRLGQTVPSGSTVDLVLSTGQVEVPDLEGLSRKEAAAALDEPAVDLPVLFVTSETSDAAAGTVIYQSEPAGSSVDQDTQITVTLAIEPDETNQPDEAAKDKTGSQDKSGSKDKSGEKDKGGKHETPSPTPSSPGPSDSASATPGTGESGGNGGNGGKESKGGAGKNP